MSNVCCFICNRYMPAEKLAERRCINREACYAVAARKRGRKISKRLARAFQVGESALRPKSRR